ncbi:DNA ligase [Thiorhodococcus minor]|uniref:DNA ligase n=1 Tax=Thiorhodococcus minor TaxID=57489 RepID=UPI0031597D67
MRLLSTSSCSWLAVLASLSGPCAFAHGQPDGGADAVSSGPEQAGSTGPTVSLSGSTSGAGDSLRPPDLMLAEVYQQGMDLRGYWMSEKLDGVRAYWDGRRLISRGGKVIQAPAWFTAGFPSIPLDGELWMGRGSFERVSGVARRSEPDPEDWREVRFMVFDLPVLGAPFTARLAALQGVIAVSDSAYLAAVEQQVARDHAGLMRRLREIEQVGGEGLMLHLGDASYRPGRSAHLLKVKSYLDAEARVVGHVPGRGRLQGMLGSLIVEDEQGFRFRIGTGFSDAERRSPPALGSWITFRYQGRTGRGIPRFARFLRVKSAD